MLIYVSSGKIYAKTLKIATTCANAMLLVIRCVYNVLAITTV